MTGTCPRCGEDWDAGTYSDPPYNNCTCDEAPRIACDEDWERCAAQARQRDFADTDGCDWT